MGLSCTQPPCDFPAEVIRRSHRVFRCTDGPADHQIIRSPPDSFFSREDAFLIITGNPGQSTDSGGYDHKVFAAGRSDGFNILRRSHNAGQVGILRHALRDRLRPHQVVEFALVGLAGVALIVFRGQLWGG